MLTVSSYYGVARPSVCLSVTLAHAPYTQETQQGYQSIAILDLSKAIIIIIVYYATKAANIHSYTYKHTIKNKIKFKKNSAR